MNRVTRTKSEWEEIQVEFEKSGKTQELFCKERNIPISSFCRWRKKLQTNKHIQTELIKIVKKEQPSQNRIVIQTDYCKIILTEAENVQTLSNLLCALKRTEHAR